MSKNSSKQNVTQLLEWLTWRKPSSSKTTKTASKRFSKTETYKQSRNRYGKRKRN